MSIKVTRPDVNLRSEVAANKLGVGAVGGQVLQAQTPQQVQAYAPGGRRNMARNGNFAVNQRDNASVTVNASSAHFPVDGWWGYGSNSAGVFTLARDDDAPIPHEYSLKATVTTADTSIASSNLYVVVNRIAGDETISHLGWPNDADHAGQAHPLTMSFWIKTSVKGEHPVVVQNAGQDRCYVTSYYITSPDTWQYITITVPPPYNGTWNSDSSNGLQVQFGLGVGADYRVSPKSSTERWLESAEWASTQACNVMETLSATWQIAGFQLEAGSVATPFEYLPFADNLRACQRYYYVPYTGDGDDAAFMQATTKDSTTIIGVLHVPTQMRANPTIENSSAQFRIDSSSKLVSNTAGSTVVVEAPGRTSFVIKIQGWTGLSTDNNFICKYIDGTFALKAEV